MIVIPVFKKIHFIMFSPVLRDKRGSCSFCCWIYCPGIVTLLLCSMPFPSWTRTEGVVLAPEESLVRSRTSGFISSIKIKAGFVCKKR